MEQREQEIHLKRDKLNGSFTSFPPSFFVFCVPPSTQEHQRK